MSDKKLTTASVLAFERKIDPSDALLYSGNWQDIGSAKWQPLAIREKAVRGTISNRLKNKKSEDPARLDAEVNKANLQTVDVVTLPAECDTLKVEFTLRILGEVSQPSVCNDADYQQKLQTVINDYITEHGFVELSKRYAYNLASGRFLWRNRVGAEEVKVIVSHYKNQQVVNSWEFNGFEFNLRDFSVKSNNQEKLDKVAKIIADGLNGDGYALLKVAAFARVGTGQEVFPSQELVLDSKENKSKILYDVNDIAAMHSQKIGNAIRTIDTWYPTPEEGGSVGPISVEPYGSVTSRGKAYRQPTQKADFYTLFDRWILSDNRPEIGNQHYVVANLIRGGVFGESGKE